MRTTQRSFVWSLLLTLALSGLAGRAQAQAAAQAQASSAEGGEKDGLALQLLDGEPFSLDSLKGRVVLLDFWAPWCVPCRKSFPFLDALAERHKAEGFSVVGVTMESDGDAVRSFLDEVPVGFPIVRDAAERSGEVFKVVSMPTAILLDRQGQVLARFEGGGDKVHQTIERAVQSVLAGRMAFGGDVRVAAGLEETGAIKAWRRGLLADPVMSLDGDPLSRLIHEHVHSSKEGAAGDGGAAGGGCGCN